MTTAHRTDVDMSTWGPGVTHWAAGGKWFAVQVDHATNGIEPVFLTGALREIETYFDLDIISSHQILPRPTVLIRCDENGVAIDGDTLTEAVELITEHEFPPGTTDWQAIVLAGYEVE